MTRALRAHHRTRTRRGGTPYGPSFFVVHPDHDELVRIATLVDDGSLRPVVAGTFALEDGRAAFGSGDTARPPGKVVLLVRP